MEKIFRMEVMNLSLPLTEMPRSLSDSPYYYKSVGCRGIFRWLLSRTVSCLQARRIIQEINAAFVESRKCCRVKILISSKSLTFEHQELAWTFKLFTHIFSTVPPKIVWFFFPVLNLWQRTCPLTAFGNQGHLLNIEMAIKRIHFK